MGFHNYECILYCSGKYFTERLNTSYSAENIMVKDIYGEKKKKKKRQTQASIVQDWLIKAENKRIFCLKVFLA